MFDAEGTPIGDNYAVADGPARQDVSAVAQLSDGALLFTWQERVDGDLEVLARQVPFEEVAEGVYTVIERPYLALDGRIEGPGEVGTTLRAVGDIDTNYALTGSQVQWFRADATDGAPDWEPIAGAIGLRLELDEEDVGHFIRVEATVRNAGGVENEIVREFREGGRLAEIDPAPLETQRLLEIDGTPVPGETLTARATLTDPEGPLDGPRFYQWSRDGEPIPGEFGQDYVVTEEDATADLSVSVRFQNADGAEEVVSSDPVEVAGSPTDGDDLLIGTEGADTLEALGGDDRLEGLAGDDWLYGGAGADDVKGGAGADILVAQGDDTLEGGAGGDFFAFAASRLDGIARIVDFQPDAVAPDEAGDGRDFLAVDADLIGATTDELRPPSRAELRAAIDADLVGWRPLNADRTSFALSFDPDGAFGPDELQVVATVTAAGDGPLELDLGNVLLF
jgi:Ca2+-binding RTX toxin-like protein